MKSSTYEFNCRVHQTLAFIVGFFLLFNASIALGQEHSFGKEEHEHHVNLESGTNHELELSHSKSSSVDSLALYRPMITRPKLKQSEARNHEDEDALKFNFLYIIIQKFKFSDIIE